MNLNKSLIAKLKIRDNNWYFNSCAFFYMTADKNKFINLKPFNNKAADGIIGKEIISIVIGTI